MFKIKDSTILISRGDTAEIDLVLYTQTGTIFTPSDTQTLTFLLYPYVQNPTYKGVNYLEKPIYSKQLDGSTLHIEPKDTLYLSDKSYHYEIDMTIDYDSDNIDDNVITTCSGNFIIE